MLQLRPYTPADAPTILSWCRDESAFYRWTAGMLGGYPPTPDAFRFVEALTPFTAVEGGDPVGFFTLRQPGERADELRFGFVIVDPARRGQGLGRAMLRLGMAYAFDRRGARRVSLGVFEDNLPARRCYLAAGLRDVTGSEPETYRILGEDLRCREMLLERP